MIKFDYLEPVDYAPSVLHRVDRFASGEAWRYGSDTAILGTPLCQLRRPLLMAAADLRIRGTLKHGERDPSTGLVVRRCADCERAAEANGRRRYSARRRCRVCHGTGLAGPDHGTGVTLSPCDCLRELHDPRRTPAHRVEVRPYG